VSQAFKRVFWQTRSMEGFAELIAASFIHLRGGRAHLCVLKQLFSHNG
jgi:hypothetical protein